VLTPGDWLQIWGEKTVKSEYEVKLKAYRIRVIAPNQPLLRHEASPFQEKASKPKASVLVCQKSDCARRGAKGICKALENALSDRGLTDEVTIRGTGCMKHCKAGPNIVFMPDKTRYSRVCAEDISDLIDQHFPAQANSTPNTQESAEEETKRNTPVTIA
jgi:(2Fe-2S) ferredoxin